MSEDMGYRFDIATNRSEDKIRVLGVELYARSMTLAQQLSFDRMRREARKAVREEASEKSVLEYEMEALIPVLRSLVVDSKQRNKITEEWLGQLQQAEYFRLFNFLLTGKDLEEEAQGSDTPNVTAQTM